MKKAPCWRRGHFRRVHGAKGGELLLDPPVFDEEITVVLLLAGSPAAAPLAEISSTEQSEAEEEAEDGSEGAFGLVFLPGEFPELALHLLLEAVVAKGPPLQGSSRRPGAPQVAESSETETADQQEKCSSSYRLEAAEVHLTSLVYLLRLLSGEFFQIRILGLEDSMRSRGMRRKMRYIHVENATITPPKMTKKSQWCAIVDQPCILPPQNKRASLGAMPRPPETKTYNSTTMLVF